MHKFRGLLASVVWLLLTNAEPAHAQPARLKIVVISGEDAVNVIQQRSASAPVVEVRDANNLPVAGATVTFSIRSAGATFGNGARTVSVITNASGQAAATGLTPTAAGAVEIQAAASFQGQTAAAVITQTNVATAAQTAAASGAATGGSGGISGTTIGIAGAAAGSAAIVATQLGGENATAPVDAAPPPPPTPTRTNYSGAYSGRGETANVADNPADFVTCVETLEITGTLTMNLTQDPSGAITGTATTAVRRVDVGASASCPAGTVGRSATENWEATVNGTTQSLQFSKENPIVSTLQPGTRALKFTGRIENGAVVGTVVWTEAFGGLTAGERQIRFTARGSSTFDLTLRP